jgi:hypothetical protein
MMWFGRIVSRRHEGAITIEKEGAVHWDIPPGVAASAREDSTISHRRCSSTA